MRTDPCREASQTRTGRGDFAVRRHDDRPVRGLYDARGIFCAYVCDRCESYHRSRYRPEIFGGYGQADVDEPIEEEEPIGGMTDSEFQADYYDSRARWAWNHGHVAEARYYESLQETTEWRQT